jgi:hypothetical protein
VREKGAYLTIAYILTTNGKDIYADMALASIISVRLSNPSARVSLVCDVESAEFLMEEKSPLIGEADDFIKVQTPKGGPVFRNRWIKTQAILFVKTPCLLLDADTLVRSSFIDLFSLVDELGVVANHNRKEMREQIYCEDVAELQKLGWPSPENFSSYANGGFLFFFGASSVRHWFQAWHQLWLGGYAQTGRPKDQPALNTSLNRSHVKVTLLPDKYNLQVNMCRDGVKDAVVWHFYASSTIRSKLYLDILRKARNTNTQKLRNLLSVVINASDLNRAFVTTSLDKKIKRLTNFCRT